MTIVITLPLCPTSNNLYATGVAKRRFRTREYDAWIMEAGWALATHRVPKQVGKVSIMIEVREPPTARREDVESRCKAGVDILVRHGIIPDDSQHYVRQVTMAWAADVDGIRISIRQWKD